MEEKNSELSLREHAQVIIDTKKKQTSQSLQSLSFEEIEILFEELEIHKIELEMQNENLKQIQTDLIKSQRRYFDLYDMAPLGYCTISYEGLGLIQEVNLAASNLLDIERYKLIGQPISNFIFKDDQDIFYLFRRKIHISGKNEKNVCELRMKKSNGIPFWVRLIVTSYANDMDTPLFFLIISDIDELKKHEKELENIVYYDSLTGLPNRVLLSESLTLGMAQAKRNYKHLAVIFLDLDSFKEINDTHGHRVGDQLLVELSHNMKQTLREGDTLSRIGGDEFIVVLFNLDNNESSLSTIVRLLDSAKKNFTINNLSMNVSASIGVTFYPQMNDIDAEHLLRQADQAMYEAKIHGKNQYHIFDELNNDIIRERFEDIVRLGKALDENEFVLHYQPKVNMNTGEIIGAEALIRWQHPQKGLIAPLEFLPIIEGHTLSIKLGEWVIHSALSQIEIWQEQGINVCVSVNIGARQLLEGNFVQRLQSILAEHPSVHPSMLEIEVLETSKLEDVLQAKKIMEASASLGVLFSLDDFGTGYSSLTYLKQLPIKYIKIDQSFIKNMLNDPNDLNILEGIISLSEAFGRYVIAEGVETLEHGLILLQLGCVLGQGYAIARPMPSHEFTDWTKTWEPDSSWRELSLYSYNQRIILFAKVEHRAWIAKIKAILNDESTYDKDSDDVYNCNFGKWLKTHGEKYFKSANQNIDEMHHKIHIFAEDLLQLYLDGHKEEATKGLDALYKQRDNFLQELEKLTVIPI